MKNNSIPKWNPELFVFSKDFMDKSKIIKIGVVAWNKNRYSAQGV